MVNYENAKIYKLVCNKTGMIYVGSTCQRLLCKRLSGHVADYKRWKNGKTNSYVTSFKIIEGNDYYIELLDAISCNSFDELAKNERFYIESIDCVNKFIPGRTNKEYKQEKLALKVKYNKCGCGVRKDGLLRHQRSLKCQTASDILQELDELN